MKKECAYTQGMLSRYLKGHLFLPQQKRVKRHLASCAVCRSRHDALRQTDETRELLRYLDADEGMSRRLRAFFAGMTKLFFRPLWLAAVVAAALAVQHFVVTPLLHDPDLERLDAGPQPPGAALQSVPSPTLPPASEPETAQPVAVLPAAGVDPLVVTIMMEKEHEKAGIARINEAMKEHSLLKSLRFSDKVREIAGSLTADELATFFNRIQGVGRITYKRSRLASAGGEVLPFVMRLQTQTAPPRTAVERPEAKPAERPAGHPADKTAEAPLEPPAPGPAPAAPQQGQ